MGSKDILMLIIWVVIVFKINTCLAGEVSGCTEDADCPDPTLSYCNTVTSSCVECLVHEACDDVCDPDTHACVECLGDSDCETPTPFCEAGQCVGECSSDADCGVNEMCDTATTGLCGPSECASMRKISVCVGLICNSEHVIWADTVEEFQKSPCYYYYYSVCNVDSDPCNDPNESCDGDGLCSCDTGYIRENGGCIPDCDPACPEGQICTREQTCTCGPTTVMDEFANCVVCLPGGSVCKDDGDCPNEGEICSAQNECICPNDKKLFHGRCVERGRLGGWCWNGKCLGSRLKCNLKTYTCMCRSSYCEPTEVCLRITMFACTKSRRRQ